MASRKEERDQLRAEREERQAESERQQRKRLMLGYTVAGVISLAVVAGIVAVVIGGGDGSSDDVSESDSAAAGVDHQSGITDDKKLDTREGTEPAAISTPDLAAAADEAGCELRENLKDEGNGHLNDGDKLPKYETTPPTSGDHYGQPQADGAYAEPLDPGRYIHSMEHGRIVIHYSPELSEADQLAVRGVFGEAPDGVLLAPNPDMRFEVAATAWTQLLGCDLFEGAKTLDALRDFRDTWIARGPEAIPL
jgi:hypothetical protein